MMRIMKTYQSAVQQVFQQYQPPNLHQIHLAPARWLLASHDYQGPMLSRSLAASKKHQHGCELIRTHT